MMLVAILTQFVLRRNAAFKRQMPMRTHSNIVRSLGDGSLVQLPASTRWAIPAEFCHKRIEGKVAEKWINRKFVLTDRVVDERGTVSRVPRPPLSMDLTLSRETLQRYPGAQEAYDGIQNLKFEVCKQEGLATIIRPEHIAQFLLAPADIKAEVEELEKEHSDYKDTLAFMSDSTDTHEHDGIDSRGAEIVPPLGNPLIDFENLDALKSKETLDGEVFVAGDRRVKMLLNKARTAVFLLAY